MLATPAARRLPETDPRPQTGGVPRHPAAEWTTTRGSRGATNASRKLLAWPAGTPWAGQDGPARSRRRPGIPAPRAATPATSTLSTLSTDPTVPEEQR